jgi:tRNA-dihydrouridine synthase 1
MSAEGHLTNPALFAGINPPVWSVGIEYLDLVDLYPCPTSFVRGHLFKMLHHLLQIQANFDLREVIAKSSSLLDFRDVVKQLQLRYQDYEDGNKVWQNPEELAHYNLVHPPWICQPYVRPPPEVYVKKMEDLAAADGLKRQVPEPETSSNGLSKKKQRKLNRNPNKKFLPTSSYSVTPSSSIVPDTKSGSNRNEKKLAVSSLSRNNRPRQRFRPKIPQYKIHAY